MTPPTDRGKPKTREVTPQPDAPVPAVGDRVRYLGDTLAMDDDERAAVNARRVHQPGDIGTVVATSAGIWPIHVKMNRDQEIKTMFGGECEPVH